MRSINVREVQECDLDAVTALEAAVWSPLGTPVLDRDQIGAWYEKRSPFFLIAEEAGVPCGYYFGQLVGFSLDECADFFRPGQGTLWEPRAHDPSGTSLFGINIVSRVQGTGGALYARVRSQCEDFGLAYSVGVSRLAGLAAYMEEHAAAALYDPGEVALWYALESAELLGMRTWDVCPEKPHLTLPRVRTPDPVLRCHAKGGHFGITGLYPKYIEPDPESRDYGVCIVSAFPHRHP